MTTATISKRIMINENVKKNAQFTLIFLPWPYFKKNCGSRSGATLHKQFRWRVSACVG